MDWIRCDGYGLCGDLLPDLIGLDDWRYPIVPDGPVDPGRRDDIQRAIDCCPMKALILEPAPEDARPQPRPALGALRADGPTRMGPSALEVARRPGAP